MIKAITIKEIRRKLEWMAFIIILTRIISMIPVPGIDTSVFKDWITTNSTDALNLFSSFTGGSFDNFSMFALGITPLISAQIIVQLMTNVLKPLSKLQKKGEYGRKALEKITNIIAIVLAIIQSACMAVGFIKGGLISSSLDFLGVILIVVFMTLGCGIMIFLSHLLTEHSIGNGVSILLMTNIIYRLPGQFKRMVETLIEGKSTVMAISSVIVMGVILILMIITIIYMTEGYHPLHVQYSQKLSNSGELADPGEIPIKVGISGVLPVIFASALMSIPQLIATIAGRGYGSGISKIFLNMMDQRKWFDNTHPIYGLGLLIYITLIVFFAFFYLPISFNAAEVSDNVRRSGAFIPGIRAGEDTENYIQSISRRLTSIGTVILICVNVIPIAICGSLNITNAVGGTSLIIVIGVVTEVIQQIRLEMAGRNYYGLLVKEAKNA